MTYPFQAYNVGRCPKSQAIFIIFLEFLYDVSGAEPGTLVWSHGDKEGYGLHSDFMNGWTDQDILQRAFHTCTTPGKGMDSPDCSIGPVVGAKTPKLDFAVARNAEVKEEWGNKVIISKLPGDNPITLSSRLLSWLASWGLERYLWTGDE
ncbi:hypothetical protein BU23DRAFT_567841 [Bimuria novae-zelandiae CBS 107.79]|uniref:DUF1996 domain-containing protein n=1 Tax=Bimuria novae-zelandiae CBS 107.79 TaxID=1447943 RepID=A0A6A5VBJ1_9PLEO|nr:hypothetical protein BU23DRAFT_567841 [Bimuria novae-zelandiae CBS 107.79]